MSSPGFLLAVVGLLGVGVVGCSPEEGDGEERQNSALIGNGGTADPGKAKSDRVMGTSEVWGRKVILHISDGDNMGWASIENGDPGDEIWLDKSIDGGFNWQGRVGKTEIPKGGRSWRTQMVGIDGTTSAGPSWGVLRACGKAGNRREVTCTPWFRGMAHSATPIEAAAVAMMQFYDPITHIYRTTGWWNSANALTAMIDYQDRTGDKTFEYVINDVFVHNLKKHDDNYRNELMDDTGWWALSWVRAYDVTGDKKYLDMARGAADYLWKFEDGTCGGGLWWTDEKKYKNAITNELFIKLAASLHNRIPGDTDYLAKAEKTWAWFDKSGMINGNHRINDGLNGDCKNNGDVEWTYNQGVILGGLVELHRATKRGELLSRATSIADAATTGDGLNPGGLLREPCEQGGCGLDGATFKGAFVRGLGELNRYLSNHPYDQYLQRQFAVMYAKNRNSLNQYGVKWAGPLEAVNAASQSSALDLFVANRR